MTTGTTIRDILGELYASASDERDKGDKFERLMAAYLRTDATRAGALARRGTWNRDRSDLGKDALRKGWSGR